MVASESKAAPTMANEQTRTRDRFFTLGMWPFMSKIQAIMPLDLPLVDPNRGVFCELTS
jgi:hypothetical protein